MLLIVFILSLIVAGASLSIGFLSGPSRNHQWTVLDVHVLSATLSESGSVAVLIESHAAFNVADLTVSMVGVDVDPGRGRVVWYDLHDVRVKTVIDHDGSDRFISRDEVVEVVFPVPADALAEGELILELSVDNARRHGLLVMPKQPGTRAQLLA